MSKDITGKCVETCALDLKPFEIVTGDEFKNLCQKLIRIGENYGNIDVEKILPHPTIPYLEIYTKYREVLSKFLPVLILPYAGTIDM